MWVFSVGGILGGGEGCENLATGFGQFAGLARDVIAIGDEAALNAGAFPVDLVVRLKRTIGQDASEHLEGDNLCSREFHIVRVLRVLIESRPCRFPWGR